MHTIVDRYHDRPGRPAGGHPDADTGSQCGTRPSPFGCPEDWERIDPDLNPLLRCQPNTIAPEWQPGGAVRLPTSTGSVRRAGAPSCIPNPALMCLPTNLVAGVGNPND